MSNANITVPPTGSEREAALDQPIPKSADEWIRTNCVYVRYRSVCKACEPTGVEFCNHVIPWEDNEIIPIAPKLK